MPNSNRVIEIKISRNSINSTALFGSPVSVIEVSKKYIETEEFMKDLVNLLYSIYVEEDVICKAIYPVEGLDFGNKVFTFSDDWRQRPMFRAWCKKGKCWWEFSLSKRQIKYLDAVEEEKQKGYAEKVVVGKLYYYLKRIKESVIGM